MGMRQKDAPQGTKKSRSKQAAAFDPFQIALRSIHGNRGQHTIFSSNGLIHFNHTAYLAFFFILSSAYLNSRHKHCQAFYRVSSHFFDFLLAGVVQDLSHGVYRFFPRYSAPSRHSDDMKRSMIPNVTLTPASTLNGAAPCITCAPIS